MTWAKKIEELNPHRITIFRALQLGDLLCAVPALRSLRRAFPRAEISLIGLPWAHEFVQRFSHYLDNFIEFPGLPGYPERTPQIFLWPGFLTYLQSQNFDLAIQLQGSGGLSNSIVKLFGAKMTAGFYLEGQYCPDPEWFLRYPVFESEVWRHLRLMEFLGIPVYDDYLEFPLYKEDWLEFEKFKAAYHLIPGEYVCIHPGSRADERRWPPERFAAVADVLATNGLRVILTGTSQEIHINQAVCSAMTEPVIDMTGRTSLGGVGALIDQARLLICNDTGVSHLAAALSTPSIILFSASDPTRWAPKNRQLHRVIDWAANTPPDRVLLEAEDLLNMEDSYASA